MFFQYESISDRTEIRESLSIHLVEQQLVNHVLKEHTVEQELQVVLIVQMVNMHHQQEVVVVQHVQQIVMVIVIRKQDYVFHVKQDLVSKMEFVHNVQLERIRQEE